jgi:N-acetylglucosaminyldiphosphoundecaprenol N-acetyl-beta-D-mannosaminyltransferase
VKIDSTTREKVLRQVQANIQKRKKFYITTPNPEQVILAQDDKPFLDILNSANLSIPDGIGIVMAQKFMKLPRPRSFILRFFTLFVQGLGVGFSAIFDRGWLEKELKLIKGREIFSELILIANKKGWNVCFVGDRLQSAKHAVNKLRASYLKVKLHPIEGPNLDNNARPRTATDKVIEKKAIEKINRVKPELVFIGFGAPKQEKWLYRLYDNLNFRGAMVIGGTFDYISEKKETPPKWVDEMNMEWFWRLIKGDQEVKRVLAAFPKFAIKIFWEKLRVKK